MGYLKDLAVSKISFVRKAANRRKFVLMKSEDSVVDNDNDKTKQSEDNKPMRKEVKEALTKILKEAKEKTEVDVVALLKADTNLKITDAEVEDVNFMIENMKTEKSATPPKNNEKEEKTEKTDNKKEEEMEKSERDTLVKTVQALTAKLENITKSTQRRDIIDWLKKDCAFLPEDVEKTADILVQLEATSPDAAKAYKDTLIKASKTVENSNLLKEAGRVSTESIMKGDSDDFDLIRAVSTEFETLRKSDKPLDAKNIVNLIKSHGDRYTDYREQHIRRAKLG